ncbi:protein YhjQ [Providencia burhodogranariea DSM 19968]|uniref:Protein YhjQ n=1 Tax=Providencia burhodogranariea DSM 19968 TaxID=1141662 RepID=K8WM47_9GAMM|nr:protein YhjQ [Providencia burhodogranariea]EKT57235.1 protein YhjQ [Providencia burhodogranariea DSM 19968]
MESENIFQFWSSNLDKLKDNSDYKWIIIDLPTNDGDLFTLLENYADIAINVAVPETNCHSRIFQNQSEYKNHILINKFDIRSELQSDIYQYWLHSLPNIIPVTIHHDEAMLEAAASKCPVGQYRPESLGASEAYALAIWCYTLLQPRDAL